ncbi:MAG: hypothetical protein WCL54_00720 [Clostridia bacterium]
MKQVQVVILILIAITIFFSSISLAKISETKEIPFSWYSEIANAFVSDERNTSGDEWLVPLNEKLMKATFLRDQKSYLRDVDPEIKKRFPVERIDFNQYLVLQVMLTVPSPQGYRIKVSEILQVSNKIYIRVSLNSVKNEIKLDDKMDYKIYDLIQIRKSDFGSIPELIYTFKDQYGIRLNAIK